MKSILMFMIVGLFSVLAKADFEIEGQVKDSLGNPVSGSAQVWLKLQKIGDADCVLYMEYFPTVAVDTAGKFAVIAGTGTRSSPHNTGSLDDRFANGASLNCYLANGTTPNGTYTPPINALRAISASVTLGANTFNVGPMTLSAVPVADSSRKIGNHDLTSLLRVENAGVPSAASPLSPSAFSILNSLLGGTIQVSGSSVGIGTTSPQAELDVNGSIRAQQICDETGGNCKDISNGWAGGGGSVTNVSVSGSPLSVTNASTTPQISIAQAGTSTSGFLSSTDWNIFNSKQPAGSYLTGITGSMVISALAYTPADAALLASTVSSSGNSGPLNLGTTDASSVTFQSNGSARMVLNSVGNLGIGAATPSSKLHVHSDFGSLGSSEFVGAYSKVNGTYTGGGAEQPTVRSVKGTVYLGTNGAYNATAQFMGLTGEFVSNNSGSNYQRGYGVFGSAFNQSSSGLSGDYHGVHGTAGNNSGSGNSQRIYGLSSQIFGIGTVNVEAAGLLIDPMISGMSVPNAYGIKLNDVNGGTNQWGIYQAGSNDVNYFAGNLGLGITAPTQKLDVQGKVKSHSVMLGSSGGSPGSGCSTAGELSTNSGVLVYCTGGVWKDVIPPSVNHGMEIFDSPGTPNWTVPPGITSAKVTVIGGGGGGCTSIGSGGSGGAAQAYVNGLSPGSTINLSVGGSGSSGASGTAGGGSSFDSFVVSSGGAGCSAGVTGADGTSTLGSAPQVKGFQAGFLRNNYSAGMGGAMSSSGTNGIIIIEY